MDTREQRGLAIADNCQIDQTGKFWMVPSQSDNGKYVVHMQDDKPHCTCPDHETRDVKCKHIYAVEIKVERETNSDGSETITETVQVTETVERKYTQDWPAYNKAQTNEKRDFQVLLSDLCSGIESPPRQSKRGRPPVPISDAIFSAVFKVYSTVSGRRFMCDLDDAHKNGHIDFKPCYNSIFKCLESQDTTATLYQLIEQTSLPLRAIETNFAVDSSGFSACRFDRWFDHKHGNRKMRTWVKVHIMCGVLTNVITAAEIRGQHTNDSPLLPPMLNTTARNFRIGEVSADMQYSSTNNLKAVDFHGGMPYIPFKSDATGAAGGLWEQMFHYYSYCRDEFLASYHKRSNVETTFHMIKAKFGDSVRSKTDVAMVNEVLAKLVCHNICCLIQSFYELGIDPFNGQKRELPINAPRLASL